MVSREQLDHAIRTACQLTMRESIIVIGSQSILATYDEGELPSAATESQEVDVLATGASSEEITELAVLISGVAGEMSPYEQTHGFYLDGVDDDTAILPAGWRDRLVPLSGQGTVNIVTGQTYRGLCLEPHDLCVAKLCALREKDVRFVKALIEAGLVDVELIVERLAALEQQHERAREVALGWLQAFRG